jgi:3-hydroxyacyl-CoA dehydrogenase/3a,7a,12a-trihydroxy-5b-cholest-24-enoyl-CoA hydratase
MRTGDLLAINELSTFVRGAGGWGGDRGPSVDVNVPPDRAPDAVHRGDDRDDQALLYRLSGDWNPLHADPVSRATSGSAAHPARAVHLRLRGAARHQGVLRRTTAALQEHQGALRRHGVPRRDLVTEMWKESDGSVVFRCKVKERDKVVISNAAVELYAEVPTKKAKARRRWRRKAAERPGAERGPGEAPRVFEAIGHYLTKNPDVAAKVGDGVPVQALGAGQRSGPSTSSATRSRRARPPRPECTCWS